jgi:hypothetical protein
MASRWLPGFPAILLIPALVLGWVSLWWAPEVADGYYERGFPLTFETYEESCELFIEFPRSGVTMDSFFVQEAEIRISHFLVDLAVALAVAYALTLGADRLLLRRLRAGRRRHGLPPSSPTLRRIPG